jgi:hypothetical protein
VAVTLADIRYAVRLLAPAHSPVCVHAALRSFGRIAGGADTVIDGFLAEGSTVRPLHVFAPLEELARRDGAVVLMGVGLDKCTLLHLAEQQAGRRLFRRWASGEDGQPTEVESGGCSNGFPRLEPALAPLACELLVGASRWRVFPARATLEVAARAIRADPEVTRCADPACERCRDAIAGGPLLSA